MPDPSEHLINRPAGPGGGSSGRSWPTRSWLRGWRAGARSRGRCAERAPSGQRTTHDQRTSHGYPVTRSHHATRGLAGPSGHGAAASPQRGRAACGGHSTPGAPGSNQATLPATAVGAILPVGHRRNSHSVRGLETWPHHSHDAVHHPAEHKRAGCAGRHGRYRGGQLRNQQTGTTCQDPALGERPGLAAAADDQRHACRDDNPRLAVPNGHHAAPLRAGAGRPRPAGSPAPVDVPAGQMGLRRLCSGRGVRYRGGTSLYDYYT